MPAVIARFQAFQQFAPEPPDAIPEPIKNFKKDALNQPF
jgi:hypothetical protein